MATGEPPIPIIDFSAFSDSTTAGRDKVVDEVLDAVTKFGFFYLSNHGIPQTDVDDMFALSSRFFALPRDVKSACPYDADTNAGWLGIAQEKLNFKEPSLDYKEALNFRKAPDMHIQFPPALTNEWGTILAFQKSCQAVFARLLRALALALRIPDTKGGEEYFIRKHRFEEPNNDILRLLYYPPVPDDGGDWIRAGGHSDYGTMTLLFQKDMGGLQVLLRGRDGTGEKFVPVPPLSGCIVVNTGDLVEFWTRGVVKSAVHRVVVPEGDAAKQSRYSIAYFLGPDPTTPLDPIPSPLLTHLPPFQDAKTKSTAYVSADAFKGEKTVTAREHAELRLNATHTY
ncbi:hypothetical protein HK104_001310 [Borealophlyctis nickersoniae]|nr:hypothetical protein HK104_001310 [Borealophlyctis nickersoniae]